MSTSVDQRSKGQQNQVSNGTEKQPEFDYMQGPPPPPQNYGSATAAQMNSPNADPYMSSYYTHHQYMFPNMGGQEAVTGGWSNGGDPMSLLGGYGQVNGGEYMSGNGMYTGGFDYSQFNWGFGGDFQTWGNPAAAPPQQQQGREEKQQQQAQQQQQHAYATEPYYMTAAPRGGDSYGNVNGEVEVVGSREQVSSSQGVEAGMKGMSLNEAGKGDGRDSGHHHHHHHHHPGSANSSGSGNGGGNGGGSGGGAPKKMSWASVASQPARPQPQVKPKSIPRAPLMPGKHGNMDIGMWDGKNNPAAKGNPGGQQARQAWGAGRGRMAPPAPYSSGGPGGQGSGGNGSNVNSSKDNKDGGAASSASSSAVALAPHHPVLDKLKSSNAYNPKEFNLNPKGARFFIIKSYSEDDIHRSIKYSIWCSTEHGNKRLDSAFHERDGKGPIFFFFSVNGSGHFCGMAQMLTPVDYHSSSSVWAQDKWKGQMEVKWIYVKDVPNSQLRHIRLENNENKPVTNSRDTQEVPPEKGKQVLRILHHYRHTTSIFDDFNHYEKRQEDEKPPTEKPQKGSRDDRKEDSREDSREERRDDRRDDGRRDDRRDDRREDRRGGDRRDRGGDDRRGGRANYH